MVGPATLWTELRFRNLATSGLRQAAQEFRRTGAEIEDSGDRAAKSFRGAQLAANLLSAAFAGVVVASIFKVVEAFQASSEAIRKSEEDIKSLALTYESAGNTILQTNELINRQAKGGFMSFLFGENVGKLNDEQLNLLSQSLGSVFKAMEGARLDKFSEFALAFQTLQVPFEVEGQLRKTSEILDDILNKVRDRSAFEMSGGTGAIEKILGPNAVEFIKEVERNFLPLSNAIGNIAVGTQSQPGEPQLPKDFKFFSELKKDSDKARADAKKDWDEWMDSILKEMQETEKQHAASQKRITEENEARSKRQVELNKAIEKSVEELNKKTRESTLATLSPLERELFLFREQEEQILALLRVTGISVEQQQRLRKAATEAQEAINKERGLAISKPDDNLKRPRQAIDELRDGMLELRDLAAGELGNALNAIFVNLETRAGNFRDLLLQLGQSIAQTVQQVLIMTAVKAGFAAAGFPVGVAAKGAVWQGGFQAFAAGSPNVDRPTLGLIGEGSNSEAVIPLPDNRNVPVKVFGNTGGEIHLTIVSNDAKSFEDLLNRPGSRKRIREEIRAMTAGDLPYRRQVRDV